MTRCSGTPPDLPPDPERYFGAVRRELNRGAQIVFGNLEGTLTTAATSKCESMQAPSGECFAFRDPPGCGVSLYRLAERRVALRHRYLVASSPVVAGHLRSLAPRAEVVLAPLSLDPGHYPSAVLEGPPVAGLIGTGTWPPTAASIVRLYHACAEGVPLHVIYRSLSAAVVGR